MNLRLNFLWCYPGHKLVYIMNSNFEWQALNLKSYDSYQTSHMIWECITRIFGPLFSETCYRRIMSCDGICIFKMPRNRIPFFYLILKHYIKLQTPSHEKIFLQILFGTYDMSHFWDIPYHIVTYNIASHLCWIKKYKVSTLYSLYAPTKMNLNMTVELDMPSFLDDKTLLNTQ